jgi:hypothetical protein
MRMRKKRMRNRRRMKKKSEFGRLAPTKKERETEGE